MTLARNAAIIVAVLLFLLAAFQLALALGAPWGRAAFGGFTATPGTGLRISSGVAVLVWSCVALLVLRRGGVGVWAPLPDSWLGVAIWVVAGVLALSILVNAISPSVVEKAIWVPFGVVTTTLTVVVAIASAAKH